MAASPNASIFQLEAFVPYALNHALADAVELGMEGVPASFASHALDRREGYLLGALATSDPSTLDEFLDKTARRAADRSVAPTELLMADEAGIGSTVGVVSSNIPEHVVSATCDGIEAIVGEEITWTWGVPTDRDEQGSLAVTGEAPELADVLSEVETWGYSVRTVVEGPQDWRRSRATVPLVVEHPKGVAPTGRSDIWWHPRSSTMRVRTPRMETNYAFTTNPLYDPVAKRIFRELLGYQQPGRIVG